METTKQINRMCLDCPHLGKACEGTTCQDYTGCIMREYSDEHVREYLRIMDFVQSGKRRERRDEAEQIARQIRNSDVWHYDLNLALCDLADLGDEYTAADGDSFEAVLERAAKTLDVEIF